MYTACTIYTAHNTYTTTTTAMFCQNALWPCTYSMLDMYMFYICYHANIFRVRFSCFGGWRGWGGGFWEWWLCLLRSRSRSHTESWRRKQKKNTTQPHTRTSAFKLRASDLCVFSFMFELVHCALSGSNQHHLTDDVFYAAAAAARWCCWCLLTWMDTVRVCLCTASVY